MDARTKELEGLLAHSSWVRRLARQLVGDDAAADDIMQDVWVAALAARGPLVAPRFWAARVVRNLAASARRSAANLAAREKNAARGEYLPSVEEVACRAELERRLVDRVHRLPEQQRDILLLRYFEGLAPLEISRHLGIPIATVRSRSARALATLRGQLDGEYGERHAWHAAFGPLVLSVRDTSAAGLSQVLPMSLAKLAVGALFIAVPAVLWSQNHTVTPADSLQAFPQEQEIVASTAPGPGAEQVQPPVGSRRDEVVTHLPRSLGSASEQKPAEESAPTAPAILVRGEVILRAAEGEPQLGLSGKGLVQLWRGTDMRYRSIVIEQGRFQLSIETPADLELRSVTLDGRTCQPEIIGERFPTDGTFLSLHVVRSAEIQLSVLDATTLRHLDGLELWDCTSMPSGGLSIPDMHWNKRALQSRRSPLVLHALPEEFRRANWRYLVRSPGYAWTPLKLDMRKSGAHELHLQRAAQIDVTLPDGRPQAQATYVRIYRDAAEHGHSSSLVTEQSIAYETRFEFQGLPPGTYQVRVEVGSRLTSMRSLAQTEVQLVPGAHELVSLTPVALDEATFSTLAGTVFVPPAWEVDEIYVFATLKEPALRGARSHSVLPQKDLWAIPETPGAYRFSFSALQTGNYTVGVGDRKRTTAIRTSLDVELGPHGLMSVHLNVPVPATVQVLLLEGSTGRRVRSDLLWGRGDVGSELRYTPLSQVVFDPESSTYNFSAPVGQVSLFVFDDHHVPVIEQVTIREGTNTFTLVLEPVCVVHIRLQGADGPLSVEEGWRPRVESLGAGGRFLGSARDGEGWVLRFTKPGSYRLTSVELPGFKPVNLDLEAERDLVREYDVMLPPE